MAYLVSPASWCFFPPPTILWLFPKRISIGLLVLVKTVQTMGRLYKGARGSKYIHIAVFYWWQFLFWFILVRWVHVTLCNTNLLTSNHPSDEEFYLWQIFKKKTKTNSFIPIEKFFFLFYLLLRSINFPNLFSYPFDTTIYTHHVHTHIHVHAYVTYAHALSYRYIHPLMHILTHINMLIATWICIIAPKSMYLETEELIITNNVWMLLVIFLRGGNLDQVNCLTFTMKT